MNNPFLNLNQKPKSIIANFTDGHSNESTIRFNANEFGEYKLVVIGNQSLSNFQFKCSEDDLTIEAEEENWDYVFKMLNSGTRTLVNLTIK